MIELKIRRAAILSVATGAALFVSGCNTDRQPRVNPAPKVWAVLAADTHDLPFIVDAATLSVTYTIESADCLKPKPVSGAIAAPFITVRFDVQKASNQRFEARIPTDHFLNEDYDGRGVCRWGIASADFTLKHGERAISAGMAGNAVVQHQTASDYFSTWSLESAPTDKPQAGLSDPVAVHAAQGEKIYSVTITAKEAMHDRANP